jgi:hypothetical protein
MAFVHCMCMTDGCCCQSYREGKTNLCVTCLHHVDYHAKGFWKDDEFHLVSLPSLSVAPIVPTPVSKAPMITSSLPSAERSLLFKKYHGSRALANSSCRTPISSGLSNSSTVTGKSRTILKQPVAAVTLTHIEKLILMDREGEIPLRPIDEARVKGTIFTNIEFSHSALLRCIKESTYKESGMQYQYYIYTLDHKKKRKLVASNFSEQNFPSTPSDIHAICLEKTVILCHKCSDDDCFTIPQSERHALPEYTENVIDLVHSDSETSYVSQPENSPERKSFSTHGPEIKCEFDSYKSYSSHRPERQYEEEYQKSYASHRPERQYEEEYQKSYASHRPERQYEEESQKSYASHRPERQYEEEYQKSYASRRPKHQYEEESQKLSSTRGPERKDEEESQKLSSTRGPERKDEEESLKPSSTHGPERKDEEESLKPSSTRGSKRKDEEESQKPSSTRGSKRKLLEESQKPSSTHGSERKDEEESQKPSLSQV